MDLILLLTLLCVGYIFGRIAESRHYRSIIEREKTYADILLFAAKRAIHFKPGKEMRERLS